MESPAIWRPVGEVEDLAKRHVQSRFLSSSIVDKMVLPRDLYGRMHTAMREVQTAFWARRTQHGGEIRRGKRKEARPIATKSAMHVTLRAEKARGKWSLLRKENARLIDSVLAKASRKFRVKVYERANSGNHLHLLVKAQTRAGFSDFLRMLGAQIAIHVTGCRKGKALGFRSWDLPAWSRVVESDFPEVRSYIVRNRLEALGLIAYSRRSAKPRGEPAKSPSL